MAYTANHRIHTEKTSQRTVHTTYVDALFRFKSEVKLESAVNPNYGEELRKRIPRRRERDGDRYPTLKASGTVGEYLRIVEGLLQQGNKDFSDSKKYVSVDNQIMFNVYAFDVHISANGIVPLEDMMDLDSLNEFVLTGEMKKPEEKSQENTQEKNNDDNDVGVEN